MTRYGVSRGASQGVELSPRVATSPVLDVKDPSDFVYSNNLDAEVAGLSPEYPPAYKEGDSSGAVGDKKSPA